MSPVLRGAAWLVGASLWSLLGKPLTLGYHWLEQRRIRLAVALVLFAIWWAFAEIGSLPVTTDWSIQEPAVRTVVLLVIGAVAAIWILPRVHTWKADEKGRLALENEVRRTLAQVVAGVFLAFGGTLAWVQFAEQVATRNSANARAHEAQIAERLERAVDRLGHERSDVRLGAIYALDRLTRESPNDKLTIIDLLCAFVRERPPRQDAPPSTQRLVTPDDFFIAPFPPSRNPPPADVQAVVTLILRNAWAVDPETRGSIRLDRADLSGIDLHGENLLGISFRGCKLDGAQLQGTRFEEPAKALTTQTSHTRAFAGRTSEERSSSECSSATRILRRRRSLAPISQEPTSKGPA